MSTAIQPDQAKLIQEQSIEATTKIRTALGIAGLSPTELRRLSAALAIAAAEEITRNDDFAKRIRGLFESASPKKVASKTKKKSASTIIQEDDLIPIATGINYDFDPFAPPDPHFLLKLYGANQLPKALNRYTPARLKETIKLLSVERPALKPKAKATKGDLINLIVSEVAN